MRRPISYVFLMLLGLLLACGKEESKAHTPTATILRDAGSKWGLEHTHEVKLNGKFALPEIMGSGLAVFDADGDGDLDLYLVNAGDTIGAGAANRLMLRDAEGRYVATTSGLEDAGYGMGVAVGDVDNDGDLDLYVGNWGADALYLNDGSGRFEKQGAVSGIRGEEWTTSVAMLDYDLDGLLDIWVVRYVEVNLARTCVREEGGLDYCSPKVFPGVADTLYRNLGGGRFEDVSEFTGIAEFANNGLGVLVEDFNGDGYPDVYIANDGERNRLWINQKGRRFKDQGLVMGAAVNGRGEAEASMGVAAADVDGDGDVDLFMTHLANESNTLYRYDPEEGGFSDDSGKSGLGDASRVYTGFGTVFCDVDNDGDEDLVVANGRVGQRTPHPDARLDSLWNRFAEPNQIFINDGQGRFAEVARGSDAFLADVAVSRGLAAADLDGDGDQDLVLSNCRGPAKLYENVTPKQSSITVDPVDPDLKRTAYGAVVIVEAGGRKIRRTAGSALSYLTSVAAPLHFGLGSAKVVDSIEIIWPGGTRETFDGGEVGIAYLVRRGGGRR